MPEKIAKPLRLVKEEERPFWQELEDMLRSDVLADGDEGLMKGSMSAESWKAFLKMVRDEVLQRLDAYRHEAGSRSDFCASSLGPYKEERLKIERAYLRNLAVLYRSTERAYKTLSG